MTVLAACHKWAKAAQRQDSTGALHLAAHEASHGDNVLVFLNLFLKGSQWWFLPAAILCLGPRSLQEVLQASNHHKLITLRTAKSCNGAYLIG
jgi:hypothetical protein